MRKEIRCLCCGCICIVNDETTTINYCEVCKDERSV